MAPNTEPVIHVLIKAMIAMIEVEETLKGKEFSGTEIIGYDIGPDSKRSVFGQNRDRKVVKVGGHMYVYGRWGQSDYAKPRYFLVKNERVLVEITYDKADAHRAKSYAIRFLDSGELPKI